MSRKRNLSESYRQMRLHLRLRQSDRKKLEEDIESVGSGRATILVAGYESWDIKTASPTPLHAHVLIETPECKDTVRSRVKARGYSTGVNYYLKEVDNNEDNYRYMCKGHRPGEYDVGWISEDKAFEYHHQFWEVHAAIERRKDKSSSRTPLYFQIAEYVQNNRGEFEKFANKLDNGTIVSAETYCYERDGPSELISLLDTTKTIKYIVEQYSKNGPLFDHETIKKTMWMIASRIDIESTVAKAERLVGEFKCEW